MADTSLQPDKHVEDQIDAYALGILEDEAVVEIERHLEHCAHCQRALRQAREVSSLLLLAPRQVAPPAHLKQRILSRIAQESALPPEHPETHPPARSGHHADEAAPPAVAIPLPDMPAARRGWKGWLGRLFSRQSQAQAAGRPQGIGPTLTEEQIETMLRLLHSPTTAIWELAGTPEAPRAHARLLGSPQERTALLLVQGLAPLPPERDYQLWFLREGKPVSSAIFDVRQNGQGQWMIRAPRQLAHYDLAAITPEPAGGSPGPTGPIVLAGELKAA